MGKGKKQHNLDQVNLMGMRCLMALAEAGTFLDASVKLNVTPTNMSFHLKNLEHYVQQPLFVRWKKNTKDLLSPSQKSIDQKLTPIGLMVYELAEVMVSAADELRCLARSYNRAKYLYGGSPYVAFYENGVRKYRSTLEEPRPLNSEGEAKRGSTVDLP
jgi:hypothetical protein